MFKHYLLTSLRHFRRHSASTLVNVFGLALGFSCVVLTYGIASYFDRHDQQYADADRTYFVAQRLYSKRIGTTTSAMPFTGRIAAELIKNDFPELQTVARATPAPFTPVTVGSDDRRIDMAYADPEFLDIFPQRWVRGEQKNPLSRPRSAIITQSLATKLFGGADPLGRTFLIRNQETVTVTGVFASPPQPSHFGDAPSATFKFEALVSMDTQIALSGAPGQRSGTGNDWEGVYYTYLVLPASRALNATVLNERLQGFAVKHGEQNVARELSVRPIADFKLTALENGANLGQIGLRATTLLMLLAAAVLAIACLNYANLATALGISRANEIGLRRVIGAGRSQLACQYMVEAQLIAAAALILGVLAVALGAPLMSGESQWNVDLRLVFYSDAKFWLALLATWLAVGFAAGAYPAFSLSRMSPASSLRQGARGRGGVLWTLLVAAQFAVTSALVVSVLVIREQNAEVERFGMQAATAPVVIVQNNLQASGVDFEVLRAELLRYPGIEAVTGVRYAPWSGTYAITGLAPLTNVMNVTPVVINRVSYDYFSAIGFEQLAGRVFDRRHGEDRWPENDADNSPRHVVIDRSLAAKLGWSDPLQAVGKYIHSPASVDGKSPARRWLVIGVVEDKPLLTTGSGASASAYLLAPAQANTPLVRISKTDVAGALAHINSVWRKLSPRSLLARRFMDQQFELSYAQFRTVGNVLTTLAALAFAVALAGLVGMAVHVVARRRHEIGVRKTLGASVGRILAMLLGQFSRPIVVANLISWPLAFVVTRAYVQMFARQIPSSAVPYLLSLAITFVAAAVAVIVQSIRAARLNPVTVLRYE